MRLKSRWRTMNTAATATDSRPMHDHHPPRDLGLGPGGADLIDPQDGQEGATGDPAGQQRADHARGLAVGVGLPVVHGGQAHLRAVADEQQDERGVQPGGREVRRVVDQLVEQQRRFAGPT